jgi:hypothetical protein
MTTIEQPLIAFDSAASSPRNQPVREGERLCVSYIELEYVFPDVNIAPVKEELTENELIQLAESVGSFSFLDSPEEDIYNDVLNKAE